MRILWLCNIALPTVAEKLRLPISNKEGWLTGLSDIIMKKQEENKIELGVCFPISEQGMVKKGDINGMRYYGFYENTAKETEYAVSLDRDMERILKDFKPDVVHVFGTEFAHSLAMVRSMSRPERMLLGIQGVCSVCAKHYADGVPDNIRKRALFRDLVKQDTIVQQQEKFYKRGKREHEILQKAGNITGRTEFDRRITKNINKNAKYYVMNETLRGNFYNQDWKYVECERYTVFMSQGDYPLKGLHRVVEAIALVKKEYPTVKLKVAGNKITANNTFYQKIKISSYGKYILDLIKLHKLEKNIVFLGMLNAEEMCRELKRSHIFVNASSIENSPNSLGEAMLLGIPCVASDVGGVPSMITHEKEGLLYRVDDIKQLAGCIMRLFREQDMVERMSKEAKERAKKTHNADRNYETLMEIYKDIVGA